MLDDECQHPFDKGCCQYGYRNGRRLRVASPELRDDLLPPKPKRAITWFIKLFCKSVERLDVLRAGICASLYNILDEWIRTRAFSLGYGLMARLVSLCAREWGILSARGETQEAVLFRKLARHYHDSDRDLHVMSRDVLCDRTFDNGTSLKLRVLYALGPYARLELGQGKIECRKVSVIGFFAKNEDVPHRRLAARKEIPKSRVL